MRWRVIGWRWAVIISWAYVAFVLLMLIFVGGNGAGEYPQG